MTPARLHRTRALCRRLQGWRTYLFFAPAFLLALFDALRVVDFRQLLIDLGLPDSSAKAIVAFCFLMAIVLRTATTTPPLRAPDRDASGEPR